MRSTVVHYRPSPVGPILFPVAAKRSCAIEFAVLASGSGTNLQALIDDEVPGLRLLISDVEGCRALERARSASIATAVVPYRGNRSEFTEEICRAAEVAGVQALVLAGFMRILGPEAVTRFRNRILNIHPS